MRRRGNRGSALIAVIVMLAVIGLGATAVWTALQRSLDGVRDRERGETAFLLAESGLEHAIARLRIEPAFAGAENVLLGDHRYTVVVRPNASGGYQLESVGEVLSDSLVLESQSLSASLRLDSEGRVVAYTWEHRDR